MKQLTGQNIHTAFVHAHNDHPLPLLECIEKWDKIGERARILYTRMAEYLNSLCQQCGKNDLPLNQQSGLCVRCAIDTETIRSKAAP